MKKIIFSASVILLAHTNATACADHDADYDYFNLFTQSIIKDKNYLPFLLTMSNGFHSHANHEIRNDSIEDWQKYFGKSLSYSETQHLVENISMNELTAFKKGAAGNAVLKKLGSYKKFEEGIDYLIEAKYLEPFMSIKYVESSNAWYQTPAEKSKDVTQLNYDETITTLTSLYHSAKNPAIKVRYGYQLVRFNHYTQNFESAKDAFQEFVEPLKLRTAPYYMALDQLAGAQRKVNMKDEANWNFFQVFINSKNRKESAFTSMKWTDSASFKHLLEKAENPAEKNMAYFLLGYDDFNNPIPMMEKMYDIDPTSEILKVLAARSINELERRYLPGYFRGDDEHVAANSSVKLSEDNSEVATAEFSFWQKIKNFFSGLFRSNKSATPNQGKVQSDKDLLNNPHRIPLYTKEVTNSQEHFLNNLDKISYKISEKSSDKFWKITQAYLAFLKSDYKKSSDILNNIKTTNPEYSTEITRMKMLNDIVSQPRIDSKYENYLMTKYSLLFKNMMDNYDTPEHYGSQDNSTKRFLRDILANRYFIQGEKGKSYLMSNTLSALQYNPDLELVKSVQAFYNKSDKTVLEKELIAKNIDDVGNVDAFFNLIYGDYEMRHNNIEKAKEFYAKAKNFSGIPRFDYLYAEGEPVQKTRISYGYSYDGFNHISSLIFGHNVWESFNSDETQSMKSENFESFPFIKNHMNKLQLAEAVIQLQKIGSGKNKAAAQANQLIGNLMYNTSIMGYYREVFVMDVDNQMGPKFHFYDQEKPNFQYYYKDFDWHTYVENNNLDWAITYYQKALEQSQDDEQKARILFQMASAEQGKYYLYAEKQTLNIDYNDPKYEEKQDAFVKKLKNVQNETFRNHMANLAKNYGKTQTSKSLQGSCSYYDYFLKTH